MTETVSAVGQVDAQPTAAADGVVDGQRVEAPVTWKTYLMCAFAAFGGIFFGYDSGYINGVMAMDYFIHEFTGKVCSNSFFFKVPLNWANFCCETTEQGRLRGQSR